ncbi:hypothetical protein ACET3Z_018310 [Daucus carota]
MDLDSEFPVRFIKPIIPEKYGGLGDRFAISICAKIWFFGWGQLKIVACEGDGVELKFSQTKGTLVGMEILLNKLSAKDMQFLYFQLHADLKLSVCLIDKDTIVDHEAGSAVDKCCKLIMVCPKMLSKCRGLKLPTNFVSIFGNTMPRKIRFKLSNGVLANGFYDHETETISGLWGVYKLLKMSFFDSLVLCYNGSDLFELYCFGKDCMEKKPIRNCDGCFEVMIKPSHLKDYDFQLVKEKIYEMQTIPSEFSNVFESWQEAETISVSHGRWNWNLLVRKRSGRVEILGGWPFPWKKLHLTVGDVCLFIHAGSKLNFQLEVYKFGF